MSTHANFSSLKKSFWMATCLSFFCFCLALPVFAQEEMRVCLTENPPDKVTVQAVGPPNEQYKWKKRILTIGYLDGSATLRQKVTQIAQTWSLYSGITTFVEIPNWRQADIRVTFTQEIGYWSCLGTAICKGERNSGATMSLEGFTDFTDSREVQRVTLHEFGHALGLQHEHQHPAGGIQWNVPAVLQYFAQYGWNEAKIRANVLDRVQASQYTPLDPLSIMMYSFPSYLTLNGFSAPWNYTLSETDKAFIWHMYPQNVDASFDADFYLNLYPDLRAAFGNNREAAYQHWKANGIREGRRASPVFDPPFYLKFHPDLHRAFGEGNFQAAVNHWLTLGINEGRIGAPEFNSGFYLWYHKDLRVYGARNFRAALDHWLTVGINEGRRGSALFDVSFYANSYPDLRAAFGRNYQAAMQHWLYHGIREGRQGTPEFDPVYYLRRYDDLVRAFGETNYSAAYDHWLFHGVHEGRRGSAVFDVFYYVNSYPDLLADFGNTNYLVALDHWHIHGQRENRRGAP